MSRDEHKRLLVIEDDNYTAAVTEIDGLMSWARAFLGPVIALGELSYYAEAASFDVVAPKVLGELDRFETSLEGLPLIIYRLRRAALDQMGEGAAA